MSDEANRRGMAAAGWYPDPSQPGQERLWTGDAWSKSTRPQDPIREETNPAAWHSDPSAPEQERLWDGDSWTDHTRRPTATAVTQDFATLSSEPPGMSKPPPGLPARTLAASEPVDRTEGKSLSTLGKVAAALLGLTIVANLASIVTEFDYLHYLNELLAGRRPALSQLTHAENATHGSEVAYWVTVGLAGIVFIWWFHRAYRNLSSGGITDLRYGSGWAIGGWFVPILGLVRPKKIANDIWKGSAAIAGGQRNRWAALPIPALLNWWWGCWIGGSALIRSSVFWSGGKNPGEETLQHALQQERVGIYLHQLGSVVLIVAAVLAIVLVRRVSAMQDGSPEPQPGLAPQAIEPAQAPLA